MLKLALCDDDKTFLKELSDHIEAWMLDQGEHPLVCSFSSPSALTASVADGERFDLFVLDVEMPGMDGLETAKELRRWEPNAPLLFLTSCIISFKVNIWGTNRLRDARDTIAVGQQGQVLAPLVEP